MARHQNFDLDTLIATLQQSKDSMDSVVEDLYPDMDWMCDMTIEEMEKLDAKIFRCADCGIWLGVAEMSPHRPDDASDQFCTDCRTED